MASYSFLDEPTYEKKMHEYKLLKPLKTTNEYIEYVFPRGNYVIDMIHLLIKYDDEIIKLLPQSDMGNFSLENFIENIIPYQNDIEQERYPNIDASFVTAYTRACQTKIDKLCFKIPLVRLVNMDNDLFDRNLNVQMTTYIRLIKQTSQHIIMDGIEILKMMRQISLINMPEPIIDNMRQYIESKITFEILYRETKFFNSVGQIIVPNPINLYRYKKLEIVLDNIKKPYGLINSIYDYKTMLVVSNLVSDKNCIQEIKLTTNFNPHGRLPPPFWDNALISGSTTLHRDHAEIFNIPFQIGSKYYVMDIEKFVSVYVQPLIDMRVNDINVHKSNIYDHGPKWQIKNQNNLNNLNIPNDPNDPNNRGIANNDESDVLLSQPGLLAKIRLTLKQADSGIIQIYLF